MMENGFRTFEISLDDGACRRGATNRSPVSLCVLSYGFQDHFSPLSILGSFQY